MPPTHKCFHQHYYVRPFVHIILFYLVLYYMVQVLYQLRLIKRFCEDRIFHQKYNASQQCDQMIINMFIHWNSTEKLMLSCITFFLGFFVNHVVKRWWDQITRMPRIEPMILSLAGLVWPNKNPEGGAQEITSFRVAVLRYCHLSYAMAFRKRATNLLRIRRLRVHHKHPVLPVVPTRCSRTFTTIAAQSSNDGW